MNIPEIQARLAIAGLYGEAVDGIYGPHTARAVEALFLARPYAKDDWRRWPASRRVIAAAQLFCMQDGIEVGEIDGLAGPQTRHAFEVYAARKRGVEGVESWRDSEPDAGPAAPVRQLEIWPHQTQRAIERWWALWEEEGFVSLGRAGDFDWMHVQAARL